MYSFADTCWVTIMWLNPILSLVIMYHSAKVASVFARTDAIKYPGGFWEFVITIVIFSVIGIALILKSKKTINKWVPMFFATVLPIVILGFTLYRLHEMTGTI